MRRWYFENGRCIGLLKELRNGFYANLTDMFQDRMPINLDNTVFADSYNLINVKAGYRRSFGKLLRL